MVQKPSQNVDEETKISISGVKNEIDSQDNPTPSNNSSSPTKFNFSNLEDMGDMMDDDLDEFSESSEDEPQRKTLLAGTKSEFIRQSMHSNVLDIFDDEEESSVDKLLGAEVGLQKAQSLNAPNLDLSENILRSLSSLSQEDIHKAVLNLLQEREDYKERLKMAKSAYLNTHDSLTKFKQMSSDLPMNMAQSKVHLSFLFSSPLVRNTDSRIENIMQLDYLTEINDILGVCSDIKHELKYSMKVATISNFRSTLTDHPIALHFSGHGIQNTPESLGNEYYLNKDKGNILLLEDEQGMSDYLFEEDLKYMINLSKTVFEVVFVSSCYSQFAGEVFLNAGAKHVICIRSGERISDKASLRFAKVFYETLFVKNYNV